MIETYASVPDHIMPSLINFVEKGWEPGGFLQAVLTNDLFGAVGLADDINRSRLHNITVFIHNVFPGVIVRTKKGYNDWLELEAEERDRIVKGCPDWVEFKGWCSERGGV